LVGDGPISAIYIFWVIAPIHGNVPIFVRWAIFPNGNQILVALVKLCAVIRVLMKLTPFAAREW